MTTELIAKLYYFEDEGRSIDFVKKFFKDFCSDCNKEILSTSIKKNNILLSFEEVIDFFYMIRCDVVHEGNYYKYSFKENDTNENIFSNALLPEYKINIQIKDIRKIIIESSIKAIRMKVGKNM